MRRQSRVIRWVGLVLLAVPFLSLRNEPAREVPKPLLHAETTSPPRNPFEGALRAAREARTAAVIAVNQEREKLEEWDPPAAADLNPEDWHEALMAADPGGHLARARAAARRAAALARSPAQAGRVAMFLVLIEHKAGHHTLSLHYARSLVALNPQVERGQMVLRAAARRMARAAATGPPDSPPTCALPCARGSNPLPWRRTPPRISLPGCGSGRR